MAFLDVLPQVHEASRQALALGFLRLLQGVGIERQEVAGRCSVHPLLHCKPNPPLGFVVTLHCVGKLRERARIEQVHLRCVRRCRVGSPVDRSKAAIFDGTTGGTPAQVQRLVPDGRCIADISSLELRQSIRCHLQTRQRFDGIAHPASNVLGLLKHLAKSLARHVGKRRKSREWTGGRCLQAGLLAL